jgi:TetR/AcrR family transcriptional regulator, repressor for uid operon
LTFVKEKTPLATDILCKPRPSNRIPPHETDGAREILLTWVSDCVTKEHTMTSQVKPSLREVQRLQTRQRVLGAAIAEFKRSGMASADVGAIVTAAGVAHGTFFFHFPTKEHVLFELECREEARVAADLARFLSEPHDLVSALAEVVKLVVELEQRLGSPLFKDFLGLHFSPSRPRRDEEWTDHPVIVLLVREIERAQDQGEVHPEVDAFYSAVFFLLGIYGVLSTTHALDARDTMLNKLVATAVRSLEPR